MLLCQLHYFIVVNSYQGGGGERLHQVGAVDVVGDAGTHLQLQPGRGGEPCSGS